MAATAPVCPMCNDKKGLGAPPKPDKIKKVLTSNKYFYQIDC